MPSKSDEGYRQDPCGSVVAGERLKLVVTAAASSSWGPQRARAATAWDLGSLRCGERRAALVPMRAVGGFNNTVVDSVREDLVCHRCWATWREQGGDPGTAAGVTHWCMSVHTFFGNKEWNRCVNA